MQALSLFELNSMVRMTIEQTLNREYWVEAELSECRERGGHCYMELIQKEQGSNTPVARAQARCWRSQWSMLQPYFQRTTGQTLHAGLKVLLKVYAQFHEAYGFSWIVTDIDPTFTLGDMARRRQEIIRKLKEQGIFDLQRELPLPLLCQRIAVISSETAAGYGDFCHQLQDSVFAFKPRLFPAIMQGEQVETSVITALNSIFAQADDYDCVVIIRGGGGTSDLSGFDTLALAENVANFPLPIITGIGHDRDESIIDMVSHTRVKTPTAAAQFLISHLQNVLDAVDDIQVRIARYSLGRLAMAKTQLSALETALPRIVTTARTRNEARLESIFSRLINCTQQKIITRQALIDNLASRIPYMLERRLLAEKHSLQLLDEKARSMDPALLLRRGYSITLKNGRALRNASDVSTGDEIETRLADGTLHSVIK